MDDGTGGYGLAPMRRRATQSSDAASGALGWGVAADETISIATVSLVSNQQHAFELLHEQRAESAVTFKTRRVRALLSCPGVPGTSFPINVDEPSPRRRQSAQHPWPSWPEHSNSTALSRPLQLVAGRRYWLSLECAAGEKRDGTCGVGARILTRASPPAASLGRKRWRARVHRGSAADASSCAEIVDKAECCAAIDKTGQVCVPAVTTFADGSTCAGWNELSTLPTADNAVAACPPHEEPATKASRPRVKLAAGTPCDALTDRVACCSSIDGSTSGAEQHAPCIPAVSTFSNGAVCESASHVASLETGLHLASPPPASPPSAKICSDVISIGRERCGWGAGRDEWSNTLRHQKYEVCQKACEDEPRCHVFVSWTGAIVGTKGWCVLSGTCNYRDTEGYTDLAIVTCTTMASPPPPSPPGWVYTPGQSQSSASCAELGGDAPLQVGFGEHASVAHDVQTITMAQLSPSKATQRMTFTFAGSGCAAEATQCIGDDVKVQLRHRGSSSTSLYVATADASAIAAAFRPLRSTTYRSLAVTDVAVSRDAVVWTFELTVPWESCGGGGVGGGGGLGGGGAAPAPPVLLAEAPPELSVSTEFTSGGSCLGGGVDVSIAGGDGPSVFLPWDASADVATSTLNLLLGASTAADGVYVRRGGDGHATASFTVTSLRGGAQPTLVVSSAASTPLVKRTMNTDFTVASASTSAVSLASQRVAPGGIDLLPLPGRYLSAPSHDVALSLRLGAQTSARCAAPNWEALHVGCFTNDKYTNAYEGTPLDVATFTGGFSLERCALHCTAAAPPHPGAIGFAAFGDVCTCLSAWTLPASGEHSTSNCSTTCSADDVTDGHQMCGTVLPPVPPPELPNVVPPANFSSLYKLPTSLSTTGADLPCSFSFAATATPTLTSVSASQATVNTTLTIAGTGFATGSGPPTVDVCGGSGGRRLCTVTSYTATAIECRMPDCPDSAQAPPLLVHVPPHGYASHDGTLQVSGVLAVTAVTGPSGAADPLAGSAQGGLRLTITGSGFAADAARMKVGLRASGASTDLAGCEIATVAPGTVECITEATAAPTTDAGTTLSVRVATLGADGSEHETATVVNGYVLLSESGSMTLTGLDQTQGYASGGQMLCLTGTGFDTSGSGSVKPTTVQVGSAQCATVDAQSTDTKLCCRTSPAATAGSVTVTVHAAHMGYAIVKPSMPSFAIVPAPTVYSIDPPSGFAGASVTVTMDRAPNGGTPVVMLRGAACASVVAADLPDDRMNVSCSVPDAVPGTGPVSVHLPDRGDAVLPASLTFGVYIAVTGVSPATGSAGGGTLLTVSGGGFGHLNASDGTTSADAITISGKPCALLSRTATELVCQTPPVVPTAADLATWLGTFSPLPSAAADVVARHDVAVKDASGEAAACAAQGAAGCTFGFALVQTPMLLSITPPSGSEGDMLVATGSALSLTASETRIYIDGESCEVSTAEGTSGSNTTAACPVASCPSEMLDVVDVTCSLPHLRGGSHVVTVGTVAAGHSPTLSSAVLTTTPQIRSFSPHSGSVAGGALLTLVGDGFSTSASDLDVKLAGKSCRVVSASVTQLSCLTPPAVGLTQDSTAAIEVSVRGVTGTCAADDSGVCEFMYSRALTPLLTGAEATSKAFDEWTMTISGTFGDGSNFPIGSAEIFIGRATRCIPTGTVSASALTCKAVPPPSGTHVVTLVTSWGAALGTAASSRRRSLSSGQARDTLPTVEGATFSATSVSPTSTSLAGGAALTIAGTSFSPTDTSVRVCGDACKITSISATSLTCVAPSSLHHASGVQTLVLTESVGSAALVSPSPPPLLPPSVPPEPPPPSPPSPPFPPLLPDVEGTVSYPQNALLPPMVSVSQLLLLEATMGGKSMPNGPARIVEVTNPASTDTLKRWRLGVIDGNYLKVVTLKVELKATGQVVMNTESAKYAGGHSGRSIADVDLAAATSTQSVAFSDTSNGYGAALIEYVVRHPTGTPPPPGLPAAPPPPPAAPWQDLRESIADTLMSTNVPEPYGATPDKCTNQQKGRWWDLCRSDTQDSPWLSVQLSATASVERVVLTQSDVLGKYQLWVGNAPGEAAAPATLCADWEAFSTSGDERTLTHQCDGAAGTHVTLILPGASRKLTLRELTVFGNLLVPPPSPPVPTLAITGATQSSTCWSGPASLCIDGVTSGGTACHSCNEQNPWISVQLERGSAIASVTLHPHNRPDHYQVWVGNAPGQTTAPARLCHDHVSSGNGPFQSICNGLVGEYVTLRFPTPSSNRYFKLQEIVVFGADVPPPSPPMPPFPPPDASQAMKLDGTGVVTLSFGRLSAALLPRGAALRSLVMHVTPKWGQRGSVVVAVGATLVCEAEELQGFNTSTSGRSSVEWDMQPYDMGFDSDQTPELAPLLAEHFAQRTSDVHGGCSLIVTLDAIASAGGLRQFYGPQAEDPALRPRLEIVYDPPTTAEQLAWVHDRDCDVSVAVPVPLAEGDTCEPVDAASARAVTDGNTCPHLELNATAATTLDSCAMAVSGLDLFKGCGLDRLVVGRDGVCVARIDEPNVPRAACFDTKTEGVGAPQLESWIEKLPVGATAMLVSCSRLAWPFNRAQLATSLASLGALNPPTFIDDAYALVGKKGASQPLAEARTPCCLNPDPVCKTCDQTPAVAATHVSCGQPISSSSRSVLPSPAFGVFGSDSYVAAVGAAGADGTARGLLAVTASGPKDALEAVAAMQASDADVLDAACDSALSSAYGERYGAKLATDGDRSSHWLSAGAPDAVLTLDLGVLRTVTQILLDWEAPAHSLLVLYSPTASGSDDWRAGASVYALPSAPTALNITDETVQAGGSIGVSARRLRLYMADASTFLNGSTVPVFALREVEVTSCALPTASATLDTQLAYRSALTITTTSVSPRRGSTAGGTALTVAVAGLPADTAKADVAVSVVGLPCTVTAVSATEVQCTTSSYGVTSLANPGTGAVSVTLPAIGTGASTSNATYEYIDLWSRYTSWGGEFINGVKNTIPGLETTGDSIWIQPGQRLLLDCDIDVYMLIVQGDLEFDRVDLKVTANYIFVMGGSLVVGTEREPFLQRAVITLRGGPTAQEFPVYGSKMLSCRFCTLDLHGKPPLDGRTHTKLAQTAAKGTSELQLTEPVDWDVGAEIVITSTAARGTMDDFDVSVIKEVADGGTRLVLAASLAFEHLGQTMSFAGGHAFDFRANVALLSRNVVIQGDETSPLNKHGAHIMLHSRKHATIVDRSQGESLTARIENIEVRYAGQMGRIGRYPVHFHMIGAVKNSYVRGNSIHHT